MRVRARWLPSIALAVLALTLPGCLSFNFPFGERRPLVESVIRGTSGPKILLIDIDGLITETAEGGGLLAPEEESTVSRVRE